MTASDVATMLLPALHKQGFRAVRHPNPTPNGYGHKITLFNQDGPSLGNLVVYAGKQGPRYATNECHVRTPEMHARLAQAWSACGFMTIEAAAPRTAPPRILPASPPNTIELWVDGACLQDRTGLRFGWAYVVCKNGIIVQLSSGSEIAPHAVTHRNVAAEIQAVVMGLEWCRAFDHTPVTIFHDYEGLEAWATGRWKAHTEYTQAYQSGIRGLDVSITWQKVAAHSGIAMNALVDRLAKLAAETGVRHTTA